MKSLQGKLPIILSTVSVFIILALLAFNVFYWDFTGLSLERYRSMGDAVHLATSFAMIGLYLAWLFLESRVAKAETNMEETADDRGTLEFYVAGRALTMISALCFPNLWDGSGWWTWVGMAVFAGGVAFRLVAIRTLGNFYSHRVRIQGGHTIIKTGPYRLVRHPAYLGMIAAHIGYVIFFFNWLSLGILVLLFIPAIVMRIRVEERMLMAIEGYPEYSRTKKRLIPCVW